FLTLTLILTLTLGPCVPPSFATHRPSESERSFEEQGVATARLVQAVACAEPVRELVVELQAGARRRHRQRGGRDTRCRQRLDIRRVEFAHDTLPDADTQRLVECELHRELLQSQCLGKAELRGSQETRDQGRAEHLLELLPKNILYIGTAGQD